MDDEEWFKNIEIIIDSTNKGRRMGAAEAFAKLMTFSRANEGNFDNIIERVINAFFQNEATSEGKSLAEWLETNGKALEYMVEWDNMIADIMNYEEE
jgi:hypothetical protein